MGNRKESVMSQYTLRIYLQQTPEKMVELGKGRIVEVMGKHYARCMDCDSIVRVDKPIFGDIHLCEVSYGNTS